MPENIKAEVLSNGQLVIEHEIPNNSQSIEIWVNYLCDTTLPAEPPQYGFGEEFWWSRLIVLIDNVQIFHERFDGYRNDRVKDIRCDMRFIDEYKGKRIKIEAMGDNEYATNKNFEMYLIINT